MRTSLAVVLAVAAALVFPASGMADHVTVSGEVRAELGDPVGDTSWKVVVSWEAKCLGATGDTSFYGDLALLDVDTGERIYLGGAGGSGEDEVLVERRAAVRQLVPWLRISCSIRFPDGEAHSDGPIEVTGTAVLVPARESGGGGGGGGGGGSGAPDGLPPGACSRTIRGTAASETIVGTAAADNILALGGNDIARGRAGHDCLRGGAGSDRLEGGGGSDFLDGGSGADVLVGGAGSNIYKGGSGNDTIRAANGRAETVDCGPGIDVARVDRADTVRGCEQVTRV